MCTQHFFPFLFLDMYFSLFILQYLQASSSQQVPPLAAPPAATGAEAMVGERDDQLPPAVAAAAGNEQQGNGGTSNLNRRLTVDEVENHPELVTAENVGKQLSKRGNFYVVCLFIFFVFCVIIDLTRFASLCHAFSFRA